MCGRYDNLIARETYRRLFHTKRMPQSNFPPRYNIAPTDPVPIVRVDPRDNERELAMARWGLVPWWSKEIPKIPHINARAEMIDKNRLFREAFLKRRALIPATGFYEWQKRADGKQPYRFTRKDLEPFAFAGLWEFCRLGGEEILSVAIVVGDPNPLAAAVHDRMPVILEPKDYDRWLDKETPVDELKEMLKPYPADRMQALAVSRAVNSVKNDIEECIEPIGEPLLQP
jgi:putative SOS response-associated peptidase YedK